jgi:hypothetical protein
MEFQKLIETVMAKKNYDHLQACAWIASLLYSYANKETIQQLNDVVASLNKKEDN